MLIQNQSFWELPRWRQNKKSSNFKSKLTEFEEYLLQLRRKKVRKGGSTGNMQWPMQWPLPVSMTNQKIHKILQEDA